MSQTNSRFVRHTVNLPLLGWSAGAVFFFYAWVLRVAPSVMVEELMRDFNVGAAVLGNLSAAYFYGYAGMQIPVGLLLDRFGARRLMTLAALTCALGCVLIATGHTLVMAIGGRFLIGASAAFSLVGAMAVAAQWFTPNRFAMLSGAAMGIGMAGGMTGQAPLRLGVDAFDWRTTMWLLAGAGVLIAVYIVATVRDRPRAAGTAGGVMQGLRTVAAHKQTWLIALVGLGSTAPLLGFAGLWGIPFLEVAYAMPRLTAATLVSMLIAGWGVGSLWWGWLSDRLGRRRSLMMIGILLEGMILAALIYVPGWSTWLLGLLCFSVGLFGSVNICCFALIRHLHPIQITSTAIGVVNGMVTGAGALFQPVVGMLLDTAWQGDMVAGARVYGADSFRYALTAIVASCVVAWMLTLRLREAKVGDSKTAFSNRDRQ